MILYTTMPQELIFSNHEDKTPDLVEIDYMGITLLVQYYSPVCFKVERIMSTDPEDYLNPLIQPGSILQYSASDFAK